MVAVSLGGQRLSKPGKGQLVLQYVKDGKTLQICMAFNTTAGCHRGKNCKLQHACAMAKSDGSACAGNHSAAEHSKTSD